jgi:hypothetical protein|nr:MAG TPA: hypothetical protein [Bacteriophage sp.]
MNKLEVGMYVRTDKTGIKKIYKIDNNKTKYKYLYKLKNQDDDGCIDLGILSDNNIKKASFNITDLIKPKDIILGRDGKLYQCWKIYKDYVFTYSKNKYGDTITLVDYQIDRILTKEQFESMSYRIGDDK